jgi:hypothetical protein
MTAVPASTNLLGQTDIVDPLETALSEERAANEKFGSIVEHVNSEPIELPNLQSHPAIPLPSA